MGLRAIHTFLGPESPGFTGSQGWFYEFKPLDACTALGVTAFIFDGRGNRARGNIFTLLYRVRVVLRWFGECLVSYPGPAPWWSAVKSCADSLEIEILGLALPAALHQRLARAVLPRREDRV